MKIKGGTQRILNDQTANSAEKWPSQNVMFQWQANDLVTYDQEKESHNGPLNQLFTDILWELVTHYSWWNVTLGKRHTHQSVFYQNNNTKKNVKFIQDVVILIIENRSLIVACMADMTPTRYIFPAIGVQDNFFGLTSLSLFDGASRLFCARLQSITGTTVIVLRKQITFVLMNSTKNIKLKFILF